MTIIILAAGSIYLLINYIYSSIFARSNFDLGKIPESNCRRYINNSEGTKLFADFCINDKSRKFALLYYGYGCNFSLICKLKQFYTSENYNVILICSNGFYNSGGNKKPTDIQLKSDLELWLKTLTQMFGENIKITLHGFSSTALSCMLVDTSRFTCVKNIISDSAYLFPIYLFSNIKSKLLRLIFKKKSRVEIPEINTDTLIISNNILAKDSYKLYDLSRKKSSLYIFDNLNIDEYIDKLSIFLFTPQELPEV